MNRNGGSPSQIPRVGLVLFAHELGDQIARQRSFSRSGAPGIDEQLPQAVAIRRQVRQKSIMIAPPPVIGLTFRQIQISRYAVNLKIVKKRAMMQKRVAQPALGVAADLPITDRKVARTAHGNGGRNRLQHRAVPL